VQLIAFYVLRENMLRSQERANAMNVHAEHTLTKRGVKRVQNAKQDKSSLKQVKIVAMTATEENTPLKKARAIASYVNVDISQRNRE
jgi:hypothetical protein